MFFISTGNVLESAANEFFLAFTDNLRPNTLLLFVTTTEPNPVAFTVETLMGFSFTGVATNNVTTRVTLPSDIQVFSESITERNKGIRVKAEEERRIIVYGLNFHPASSDAFLALPCDQLPVAEYEYYAISYGSRSRVLLVGCSDDTTVTTPSSTFTLNQLETYLIESSGGEDITGTRIVSNKPISFFPGHRCTIVPQQVGACDHLTEQVPPTAIWGQSFLAASFRGRQSGEIFRVLAAANATTVVVNCTTFTQPLSFLLNSTGSWEEVFVVADSFCSIESNNPILVMEFGLGFGLDGIGDPFMTMVPPVEQYSNNYVFSVVSEFFTNFITVLVAPEFFQSDRIFVDSVSLQNSSWTEVYCTSGICGFITRVALLPGEHRLYHQDVHARVGLIAYGFNDVNSYGYPGGLQLIPIQCKYIYFFKFCNLTCS